MENKLVRVEIADSKIRYFQELSFGKFNIFKYI